MEKRNGCTLSLYVGYFTLEKILLGFGGNVFKNPAVYTVLCPHLIIVLIIIIIMTIWR